LFLAITTAAFEITPPEEKNYFLDFWGINNVVDIGFHIDGINEIGENSELDCAGRPKRIYLPKT